MIYCYLCDKCDNRMEVVTTMSKMKMQVKCTECGSMSDRDMRAEQSGMSTGDTWNQTGGFKGSNGETGSLSRAIQADQVAEQVALDKQKGVNVGVEWKPDRKGLIRPHFSSKGARDRWDRAHNWTSESHY